MKKEQPQLDPLDPAEWTPNRGLLAANPITMVFIALVLAGVLLVCVLAAIGALL